MAIIKKWQKYQKQNFLIFFKSEAIQNNHFGLLSFITIVFKKELPLTLSHGIFTVLVYLF